jgi:hypothetical protein
VSDTVTVSVSLLVWVLGIAVASTAGLFSLCGHLLISIYKGMRTLSENVGIDRARVDGRLITLERHDRKNEEQRDLFVNFLGGQRKEKA